MEMDEKYLISKINESLDKIKDISWLSFMETADNDYTSIFDGVDEMKHVLLASKEVIEKIK